MSGLIVDQFDVVVVVVVDVVVAVEGEVNRVEPKDDRAPHTSLLQRLDDMVKAGGAQASVPTADSTTTSGQMKENPTKAGSDKASETPGQGDKANNGTAI